MDEVGSDEQLGATVREGSDGVCFPDFLKQAFSHGARVAGVVGGRENCNELVGLSKPHLHQIEKTGFNVV